eukprot:370557_1
MTQPHRLDAVGPTRRHRHCFKFATPIRMRNGRKRWRNSLKSVRNPTIVQHIRYNVGFTKSKKEISEEKTQSVKGLAGKASMGSEFSMDVHETSSELNSSVYEPGSERSSSAHEAGPESILSPKREGRPIIRRWAADQVSKESSYVPETGSGTSSDTHETGTCSESTGRMKNEGRHIHHWTDDQDSAISRLRESNPSLSWMEITQKFRSEFPLSIRSSSSIRNRHRKLYPSVRQKSYVIWSAEEIAVLKRIRESNPTDSWPEIAEKFHVEFPSSNRSIRSIRRRYNHPESSSKLTNYNWTEEETSALLRIRDANPSLKWSETLAKFVEECPQSHHRTMHSVQCQFSKIKKESSEEKTQSVKELPWKAGLVSEPSSGVHEIGSGASSYVHETGSGTFSGVQETGSGTFSGVQETGSESTECVKHESRSIHHWTADQVECLIELRDSSTSQFRARWQDIFSKFQLRFPNTPYLTPKRCSNRYYDYRRQNHKKEDISLPGVENHRKRPKKEDISLPGVENHRKRPKKEDICQPGVENLGTYIHEDPCNVDQPSIDMPDGESNARYPVRNRNSLKLSNSSIGFEDTTWMSTEWTHEESEYLFQLRTDHADESWEDIQVRLCRTFPHFKSTDRKKTRLNSSHLL